MLASQKIRAAPGVTLAPTSLSAASRSSSPDQQQPGADADGDDRRGDGGPAIATLNSVPGESESRSSRAMPPNIHSVIPEMPMPARIATTACPSSCRRIEAKKSSALATASR